jgi:hypothetical protein
MSLFKFGKAKEEESDFASQMVEGQDRRDALEWVPIIGLTNDMVITKDATFLMMLELSPIDMGVSGQDFSYWVRKYQTALEKIPPNSNFQITVQIEPRDPVPDINYFIEKARNWYNNSIGEDLSKRETNQASAISQAAQTMTSFTAFWFDEYQPITWRTLYTVFHRAPIMISKRGLFGFKKDGNGSSEMIEAYIPEAQEILQRNVSILRSAFNEAGIPLRLLSPGEMCQTVWRGLHPAATGLQMGGATDIAIRIAQGREPVRKQMPPADSFWPGMPEEQLASLLAPDTILEKENWIEINGVKAAGYIIDDYRPHQPVNIFRLSNLPGGWLGSIHIEYADPSSVSQTLKQREVQLSATEMVKANKGIIQSYANQQEVGAVQHHRMAMETVGQSPVYIRFMVMRTAPDEELLQERTRDLESLLTTLGVHAYPARYSQMLLWESTLPIGKMPLDQKPRIMTPASMGNFFWPSRRGYSDEEGIYLGIDEVTKMPVRVDPFGHYQEKTPTFLALGRPGAGKSVWLRAMMLSALMSGGNVMAVDIEGEMREICEQYGGRYIEIGALTGERINVLDIPPDSENPLEYGTKHLVAFCEAVRGTAIPKGPEWNALALAYKMALEDRGLIDERTGLPAEEWTTENAPTLKDIARILAQSRNPEGKSLAEMLHPYSDGLFAQYFNTKTTFEIQEEKLVVFGLRHVNESGTWSDQELQVYLWQVMGLLWGEVLRRNQRNPEVANHVMLDEVWALLRTPGGAAAIENMARRFRKRKAALWMATQQIGEFLEKEHGKQILSVVGTKFLMGVSPFEAQRMQKPFELTDHLVDVLTQLGHGRGLLQMANAIIRISVRIPKELGIY